MRLGQLEGVFLLNLVCPEMPKEKAEPLVEPLAKGILKPERVRTVSPDLIASVPTSMFLDFMGVRFDPKDADDLEIKINLDFTDTDEQFVLALDNSVLNNIPNKQDPEANASLRLTRALFNRVALGETSFAKEIVMGNVKVSGNPLALARVFGRLETFDPWFNIVTP